MNKLQVSGDYLERLAFAPVGQERGGGGGRGEGGPADVADVADVAVRCADRLS